MAEKQFTLDMTIADAMQLHPGVPEVFAEFHLTGCAFCHIARVETLDQVCESYDLDSTALLDALNDLLKAEAPEKA
jgi:hybrid cluster-associated redox disulfide protein